MTAASTEPSAAADDRPRPDERPALLAGRADAVEDEPLGRVPAGEREPAGQVLQRERPTVLVEELEPADELLPARRRAGPPGCRTRACARPRRSRRRGARPGPWTVIPSATSPSTAAKPAARLLQRGDRPVPLGGRGDVRGDRLRQADVAVGEAPGSGRCRMNVPTSRPWWTSGTNASARIPSPDGGVAQRGERRLAVDVSRGQGPGAGSGEPYGGPRGDGRRHSARYSFGEAAPRGELHRALAVEQEHGGPIEPESRPAGSRARRRASARAWPRGQDRLRRARTATSRSTTLARSSSSEGPPPATRAALVDRHAQPPGSVLRARSVPHAGRKGNGRDRREAGGRRAAPGPQGATSVGMSNSGQTSVPGVSPFSRPAARRADRSAPAGPARSAGSPRRRAARQPQDLDPAAHVEEVDQVAVPGRVPRQRARVRRRVGAGDVVVADLPQVARVRRVDHAQPLAVPTRRERRARHLEVVRRAGRDRRRVVRARPEGWYALSGVSRYGAPASSRPPARRRASR